MLRRARVPLATPDGMARHAKRSLDARNRLGWPSVHECRSGLSVRGAVPSWLPAAFMTAASHSRYPLRVKPACPSGTQGIKTDIQKRDPAPKLLCCKERLSSCLRYGPQNGPSAQRTKVQLFVVWPYETRRFGHFEKTQKVQLFIVPKLPGRVEERCVVLSLVWASKRAICTANQCTTLSSSRDSRCMRGQR